MTVHVSSSIFQAVHIHEISNDLGRTEFERAMKKAKNDKTSAIEQQLFYT